MIKFTVLTIAIIATTATVAYSLTLLDRIVHVRLYDYGLQFSLDWANLYWTVLRITLALLALQSCSHWSTWFPYIENTFAKNNLR